jgi:hypothetical protein
MSRNVTYFPSGRGARVRDRCHACGSPEFVGEVIMAYDPQAAAVYLICERCYRRRQAMEARKRWEAAMRQQATSLSAPRMLACACGD